MFTAWNIWKERNRRIFEQTHMDAIRVLLKRSSWRSRFGSSLAAGRCFLVCHVNCSFSFSFGFRPQRLEFSLFYVISSLYWTDLLLLLLIGHSSAPAFLSKKRENLSLSWFQELFLDISKNFLLILFLFCSFDNNSVCNIFRRWFKSRWSPRWTQGLISELFSLLLWNRNAGSCITMRRGRAYMWLARFLHRFLAKPCVARHK